MAGSYDELLADHSKFCKQGDLNGLSQLTFVPMSYWLVDMPKMNKTKFVYCRFGVGLQK